MPRDALPETPGVAYGAMSCRSRYDNRPRPSPRQQAKAEPEATGQCRRTWQTRFQAGVARPGARDPQGFAAVRGVTATSDMRGAPASWPSTAQPSMHNCRRRRPPLLRGRSGSKSHGQCTGSAQARAGHPPQGACCRSSARKTPAIGHRRAGGDASLVCGRKRLGHKGSALSVPAFSRRPCCGRMPSLRQSWDRSTPLPFPAPLCTTIFRAVHRSARPLVGLDGEERRIGRKKRGRRPSRLLILPTGNDQVFTNPSSQLSKAW